MAANDLTQNTGLLSLLQGVLGTDTSVDENSTTKTSGDATALNAVLAKQMGGISTQDIQSIYQEGAKSVPNLVNTYADAMGNRSKGNTALGNSVSDLNSSILSKIAELNTSMTNNAGNTAANIANLNKTTTTTGSKESSTQVDNQALLKALVGAAGIEGLSSLLGGGDGSTGGTLGNLASVVGLGKAATGGASTAGTAGTVAAGAGAAGAGAAGTGAATTGAVYGGTIPVATTLAPLAGEAAVGAGAAGAGAGTAAGTGISTAGGAAVGEGLMAAGPYAAAAAIIADMIWGKWEHTPDPRPIEDIVADLRGNYTSSVIESGGKMPTDADLLAEAKRLKNIQP
jgi:hypothetical protein